MVCSKCQKQMKKTELATPGVKHRNDMYYGSPAAGKTGSSDKSKASATLGTSGIGKVIEFDVSGKLHDSKLIGVPLQSKLLSKSAKNPYNAYSSSCSTCKTKTEQGRSYCHRCAFKANGKSCAILHLNDASPLTTFSMCNMRQE